MKRLSMIIPALGLFATVALGGGIVTNTNQSAEFVRTLNRNASTGVDAAYFNPAAATLLGNGLHIGLSNQSIFQTREIKDSYPHLNEDTFSGDVEALVFPNVHLVYNLGTLAISAALTPIGGGGSANYAKGLPSFERPVSDLVPKLLVAGQPITGYRLETAFDGSSVYMGGQAGVAYKVNDMISVSVGARFVTATNSYQGHLKNIEINLGGTWMLANTFFLGAAQQATAAATVYSDSAAFFYTLADATSNPELKATYNAYGDGYTAGAAQATGMATAYTENAAEVADKEVDLEQTGSGIAPVISVNITPMEGLNIGLRYEGKTTLELTNVTKQDAGLDDFKDGVKSQADMPAMLATGVSYQAMDALRLEGSFTYYMNTQVDWNGREEELDNGFDGGIALEYQLTETLKASVGYLYAKSGAKDAYQTDMSHSLNSNTVALGIGYALTPGLEINVGGIMTIYGEGQNTITHLFNTEPLITVPVEEKYNRTNQAFGIGINYSF